MSDMNTAASHKPRVIVADDSKLVRKTATKILEEQFDLVLAEDGEEAWQAIQNDASIQVVFTDLGMPNLDGYGLIQRIRQHDNPDIRDLPIIVITGAGDDEDVKRKVFEIGATDFVGKPFKATEIIARADAHASYRNDKEKLQENIDIDLLTGTLNRKGIDEKLAKDVSFINRHKQSLALIVFELDKFKERTRDMNQQSAEKIIQHVSKTLGNAIRREDSFGRYEYAKFITILPMAKTEGVIQLAKRLCEHIKSLKFNINGETNTFTLSVGIASVSKGTAVTTISLLQAADDALNNAKSVGPGEVQLLKLTDTTTSNRNRSELSIDNLLEDIASGQHTIDSDQLETVVKQLLPLVRLMTSEQKAHLLGS